MKIKTKEMENPQFPLHSIKHKGNKFNSIQSTLTQVLETLLTLK